MTDHPPVRRPITRWTLAVLLAAVAALLLPSVALAEPGAPTGWVRLGHLSPKTPPVDIYLSPFGQPQRVAFRQAAYGAVTPYSALPSGTYTVSMRPSGAPAASPPALSATVDVKPATALTMLVFENGPNNSIRGQLLTDDLSAPPSGEGKVRVVAGSPRVTGLDVTAQGGPPLATGLHYGDVSDYVPLRQGRWSIGLRNGDQTVTAGMTMRAAKACTLLAVDKPGGGLTMTQLPDSAGTAGAPTGGAETGEGGTQPGPPAVLATLVAGLAVGAVTVTLVLARRRDRA